MTTHPGVYFRIRLMSKCPQRNVHTCTYEHTLHISFLFCTLVVYRYHIKYMNMNNNIMNIRKVSTCK